MSIAVQNERFILTANNTYRIIVAAIAARNEPRLSGGYF
jgi:hypothetical protein